MAQSDAVLWRDRLRLAERDRDEAALRLLAETARANAAERQLAATVDELTDTQAKLAQARAEGVTAERERWRRMTAAQADTERGFW
jgi:hypothetical protein